MKKPDFKQLLQDRGFISGSTWLQTKTNELLHVPDDADVEREWARVIRLGGKDKGSGTACEDAMFIPYVIGMINSKVLRKLS